MLCKLRPNDTVLEAIAKMAKAGEAGSVVPSLAYVEENDVLVGSLSDGDIRKAIGSKAFRDPLKANVESLMNKTPLTVSKDDFARGNISFDHLPRNVPAIFVLDNKGQVVDIVLREDASSEVNDYFSNPKKVDVLVLGLGFVGLTFALHIARNGFTVRGCDTNSGHVQALNQGEVPFFEMGLSELLRVYSGTQFTASETLPDKTHEQRIYILAVGTPVEDGQPDNSQLIVAAKTVGAQITRGDLVLLRSTVKAGTCDNELVPALESTSGLVEGKDFFVAMAPERTVEGKALKELQELPQIAGANDETSLACARQFLSVICPQIVTMESLVQAELSKLICNSYRDLTFAFANELAVAIEGAGIDANELISKCNLGYSRGGVPMPSPGVGGYCLTKDPFLYSASLSEICGSEVATLSKLGRSINKSATFAPLRALNKFAEAQELKINDLSIAVVGLAFKGVPETDDLRFSTALDLVHEIENKVRQVSWLDFAISHNTKPALSGCIPLDPNLSIPEDLDAIFVLNNHPKNPEIKLEKWLHADRSKLFFDGWGQFRHLEILKDDQKLSFMCMGNLMCDRFSKL